MKNDPIFKFVAAAIFAAVCIAFYSATHFKTQQLYREAVAPVETASLGPQRVGHVGTHTPPSGHPS